MASILVLDDEQLSLSAYTRLLRLEQHNVAATKDGLEALGKLQISEFDLIITDIFMPDMTGPEFISELKKRKVETPIIVMSGSLIHEPKNYEYYVRILGVFGVVAKTAPAESFFSLVNEALTCSAIKNTQNRNYGCLR